MYEYTSDDIAAIKAQIAENQRMADRLIERCEEIQSANRSTNIYIDNSITVNQTKNNPDLTEISGFVIGLIGVLLGGKKLL